MCNVMLKQTVLGVAIVFSFGAGVAHAVTTTGNNFTMNFSGGGYAGGTNDVTFTWDETYNTNPTTAVANAALSSPSEFAGTIWTAYDIKIYGPGSYVLSTADTLGSSGCPYMLTCYSGGDYNVTVGADQVMAHMKFAWSSSQGIDLVNVWNYQEVFGPSQIFAGIIATVDVGGDANTVWDGMSSDWDGDGVNGGGMVDGPFPGFSGNFNIMGVHPVPVPAAVWLFGSGLLGLVGIARRKMKT